MTKATGPTQTKATLFQRAGAFLEAMAYSDVDYQYEIIDQLRREQISLKAQIAELRTRAS